jgi:hypothetical protein
MNKTHEPGSVDDRVQRGIALRAGAAFYSPLQLDFLHAPNSKAGIATVPGEGSCGLYWLCFGQAPLIVLTLPGFVSELKLTRAIGSLHLLPSRA